jgi:excinuclease ABC subunit A
LREILYELADGGNSVAVIERNLEVIKTADWLVDVGRACGLLLFSREG